MPSLAAAKSTPASNLGNIKILQRLTQGITRTHKEAKTQNRIQHKQLNYIKEKDQKKKNKAKKWHVSSRSLVFKCSLNWQQQTGRQEP
jgi:hypothetical protein